VEHSIVVVGDTSSIVFHFLITLTLKKGFDSGHDLDTILQILVAPRYGLQDKHLEVPSGHLNSSPVVNWKTVLLNKDRVKYQLLSVTSSEEVHWQGKVCLRTLMTTLKCTKSKGKRTIRFRA
ncbi:hypothetical protein H5410_010780, partial [Solanum commersonii]